ncbi:hypothetical protein HT031_003784 [Scenedesmus sp. PABB004]|nr:hypothetical protein HT031_003784 [Scenedesmus sp. PABB004]
MLLCGSRRLALVAALGDAAAALTLPAARQQHPAALLAAARRAASGGSASGAGAAEQHQQPEHEQQQAQHEGAYRRGFGAKVALPASDVLHEVLVSDHAATKLRAYHIGAPRTLTAAAAAAAARAPPPPLPRWRHRAPARAPARAAGARIHIGQVLALARAAGCRTNSGKDYCMVWLQPHLTRSRWAAGAQLRGAGAAAGGGGGGPGPGRASFSLDEAVRRVALLRQQLGLRGDAPGGAGPEQQAQASGQGPGEQAQTSAGWEARLVDAPPRGGAAAAGSAPALPSKLLDLRPVGRGRGQVPPLLVVYRYGSAVFAGTPAGAEASLLAEFVPPDVRYKHGGDSTWALRDPLLSGRPAEEHAVVVDPGAPAHAAKGTDQVLLRVLDVGGVRVLTSVLAQSAALKYYEMSVQQALETLSTWRARTRRQRQQLPWWRGAWVTQLTGQQEETLFKVIAASSLVINEARSLLDMAEPAWDYAAYHAVWALAAAEFELERRFKALEIKLRQAEAEAKHDVKDRAGRSYARLEQCVVLLLLVSCALAALEVRKKKARKREAAAAAAAAAGSVAAAAGGVA